MTFLAAIARLESNATRAVVNARALDSLSTTPRYRDRDFGVGYGRSEGYARSHGLWKSASRRYC
ncbi:MAG: hypothetical protein ACXIUZ_08470 [Lysobacteraceae bacterium]|mgnify:CR=1 FL=1